MWVAETMHHNGRDKDVRGAMSDNMLNLDLRGFNPKGVS